MTFKYRFLLGACRLVHAQKMMQQPPEKLKAMFEKRVGVPVVYPFEDPELTITAETVQDCPVQAFRHRKPCGRACIYLVGGGMLKYPIKRQARSLIKWAKRTNRDIFLPYYPLAYGHTMMDVYAMLYELYKKLLGEYPAENIAVFGGSSGGFHALGLVSYINERGEGLPVPGKVYAGSPGTAYATDRERERAEQLDATDVIMSTKAMENVFAVMTGGRTDIPDYLLYLQKGKYTGLKNAYLSFGGDEIFSACAESIRDRLASFGTDVTLEVAEGLYHSYAGMPLVKEAMPGFENLMQYLAEE